MKDTQKCIGVWTCCGSILDVQKTLVLICGTKTKEFFMHTKIRNIVTGQVILDESVKTKPEVNGLLLFITYTENGKYASCGIWRNDGLLIPYGDGFSRTENQYYDKKLLDFICVNFFSL